MNKILKTLLTWLPSIIITLFFIPNALDKILNSNQTDKIVANSTIIITTGIFLLISTILFLYNKTILIGATLLTLYMTFIVFIHMYKGKPYEVTILIVMTTLFAAYIRSPKIFHQSKYANINAQSISKKSKFKLYLKPAIHNASPMVFSIASLSSLAKLLLK